MIEFADYQHKGQRRDIVSFCPNCHEISGSQFVRCPTCNNKVNKKQILFCVHNINEAKYPVIFLTKTELINRFISADVVKSLTKEQMIIIAREIELFIYRKMENEIFKRVNKIISNLTNCMK